MAKITGTLTLTLHEAKELSCKDIGKQDPYAKVELKGEHFKTKTHKKGNSKATWNQSFLFNLKDYDRKEILHIQCYDEDLVSDDKIGRADLTLEQVFDITDEKEGKWIQIVDFNNFHKITGYVRISASVTGTGWPVRHVAPTHHAAPAPAPAHHAHHVGPAHHVAPTPTPTYVAPTPTYVAPTPTYVAPTHEHHAPPHHHGPAIHTTPTYSPPVTTPTYSPPVVVEKKATDTLAQGGRLHAGESLVSSNGVYTATMQHDGNFVIYKSGTAIWATNTNGRGGKFVALQSDHNLVLYDESGTSAGSKWASNTHGKGSGTAHLTMQNDGNLVLYCGGSTAAHALWASNTAGK